MPPLKRVFIPFGDFRPDIKEFGADGTRTLNLCRNVAPVFGGYVAAPVWEKKTNPSAIPAITYGLHAHATQVAPAGWKAYAGTATKLYEIGPSVTPWTVADKSRLVGGNYNTTGSGGEYGWQGTSFGDAAVMTNYVDDPQLLPTASAANFEKLAQSGGANPGMDPKAKFVFPIRGNLALANLNLAAPFDGLSAGANPTVVAWSQTENIRQYGSFNATPQLVGAGYQPIANDFGHITGGIGAGDFAVITQQRGINRMDGGSQGYVFRTIVRGIGCRFPNSLVEWDGDIYFWGPAGPSRLMGGEGPIEVLGSGRVVRSLIDNSGFSTDAILADVDVKMVSAAVDYTNGCVVWSITTTSRAELLLSGLPGGADGYQEGNLSIWWNREENRFSFIDNVTPTTGTLTGAIFLVCRPDTGSSWMPGRDLVAVFREIDDLGHTFDYASTLTYRTDQPFNLSPRLGEGFHQLDPEHATRILRVRPVYAMNAGVGRLAVTVTLTSKNRPYESATSRDYTAIDATQGWIVTPDSYSADYHQVHFRFDAADADTQPHMATQLVGFEAEIDTARGRHAA